MGYTLFDDSDLVCIICDNVIVLDSFFSRFIGMMLRKHFEEGNAMVIIPCNIVHLYDDAIYFRSPKRIR